MKWRKNARKEYKKAYRYLQKRMKYLRYAEYKREGLPLGCGVTEAACKTIYTQRLKLSGQRWSKEGAQVILDLRVLLTSDVWERTFCQALATLPVAKVLSPDAARFKTLLDAA